MVITGSHNLGYKASTKNDDNMMIVEGNAPLAAAYAINIIAIYQAYRWNTYVDQHAKDPQVWHGLVDNATWQDSYLKDDSADLAEIEFWLGEGASAPTAARQPAPAPQVHAVTATGPSPHAGATTPRRQGAARQTASPAPAGASAGNHPAKKAVAKKRDAPKKRAVAKGQSHVTKRGPAEGAPSRTKSRAKAATTSATRPDAKRTRRPR